MKYFIFVVLTSLISCTAFAQANFQPGYLILANGDRIEGFLNYQDREKNPREAVFRATPEGESRAYLPIELKEFGVADERYVTAVVETETSPNQTSKLTYDQKLNIVMDTAFLRTIMEGPKSLYQFKNDAGIVNFYVGEKDKYTLLRYKRYLEIKDGALMTVEVNLYQLQLDNYFLDCKDFFGAIHDTKYRLADLEELFEKWYACTGLETTFHKERERVSFEFGLLAGMTRTQLSFTSEPFAYLDNSEYAPSLAISGGVFLNIVLPRGQRRWSVNSELVWNSYATQADYTATGSIGQEITWHTEIGYSYIALNNMVRYRWPIGPLSMFANVGISNGIAVQSQNDLVQTTVFPNPTTPVRVEEGIAVEATRNHEQAILAGLGLQWGRFSLEGRYLRGNGMSIVSGISSLTNRLGVYAGFRL